MSTPTCPYCNAAEDPNWRGENAAWFKCGTMIHRDRPSRADQTNQCVEDEVAMLTDQRDQLLQKVQRLEEAGDVVVAVLRESEDQDFCDWIDKAYDAESKWIRAKETKP
jgi:hypothetical protein